MDLVDCWSVKATTLPLFLWVRWCLVIIALHSLFLSALAKQARFFFSLVWKPEYRSHEIPPPEPNRTFLCFQSRRPYYILDTEKRTVQVHSICAFDVILSLLDAPRQQSLEINAPRCVMVLRSVVRYSSSVFSSLFVHVFFWDCVGWTSHQDGSSFQRVSHRFHPKSAATKTQTPFAPRHQHHRPVVVPRQPPQYPQTPRRAIIEDSIDFRPSSASYRRCFIQDDNPTYPNTALQGTGALEIEDIEQRLQYRDIYPGMESGSQHRLIHVLLDTNKCYIYMYLSAPWNSTRHQQRQKDRASPPLSIAPPHSHVSSAPSIKLPLGRDEHARYTHMHFNDESQNGARGRYLQRQMLIDT